MNKSIQCYIPENLNLESIPGYNSRWRDKYIWFIHSIVFGQLRQKDSFGNYVNLNRETLQKYIGSHYLQEIKRHLINSGIVECNSKFKKNHFSKSYRLAEKYRDKPISVSLLKRTYSKKIYMYRGGYLKDLLRENTNLKHEFQRLTYFRIKKDEALAYINSQYEIGSPKYKNRLMGIEQVDSLHKTNFSQGFYHIDFTFKVDRSGRLHTPLTMLAKDLLQFLYIDGKPDERIIEIDQKNSQLCYSYNFVNQHFAENLHRLGDKGGMESINYKENKKSTSKISKIPHLSINTPYVVQYSWRDLIFNGLGYEKMIYLTKWMGTRSEFKGVFFSELFYNKYQDRLTDMEMAFMKSEPEHATKLRAVKKKLGNRAFAIKVQASEAKFWHGVYPNYMRSENKTISFGIRHDSVLIPESEVDHIAPMIEEKLKDYFGVNRVPISIKRI